MLYPTAGCRLYIADAPNDGALPSGGWIEIGETEAIGLLGSQWDVATADAAGNCEAYDHPAEIGAKGVRRRPDMPIIMANDPTDPGQLVLWAAEQSLESYPFRLVFPDGVTSRSWWALVVGMGEVFDAANNVLKLQADLKPTSGITRNEEA